MATALALLESGARWDVIVSDVMMPGGTGIQLVHQLRSRGVQTPVLLVSGFAVEALDDVLAADPAIAFLAKPWALDALSAGIEQVVRGAQGAGDTVRAA
jgi:CheY-like chemotaxis protein